ncbi:hypothetical protein [Ruegeria sp.]|uniref:hypothetical protein n=1 Tax=Ruegeria sp. TaxID=1879320 RepID=UPI00230992C9|nr:hypothetical protein [Ruegeria sp.]MDA7966024.1 hypothetical protein [Ruegeria sp.]
MPDAGLLARQGRHYPAYVGRARRRVPENLEDRLNELTETTREIIADLFDFMLQFDARIKAFGKRIDQVFRKPERSHQDRTRNGVNSNKVSLSAITLAATITYWL